MKRVFVSMPMEGEPIEAIIEERSVICKKIEVLLGEEFKDWELLDSVYYAQAELENSFFKNKEIYCLAHSIEYLSDADLAYFVSGWENSRGCKIEHEIAKQYGIEIVEE